MMLKALVLLILIIFYTFLLKRRFNVKMLDAWSAKTVGSEILVYVMIALPIILAWFTTLLIESLFF